MIPIEEARARLIALVRPINRPAETVLLAGALGRRLASPLIARRTRPPRDLSAMDGYALRSADAGRALRLIGESAAGRPYPDALGPGETVRVFTGAGLPEGADAVLIQENVQVHDGIVRQIGGARPVSGTHVRRAGFDFRHGDVLADAGTRADPRTIALAAASGNDRLSVRPPVRVALMSTGNELVPPGVDGGPDALPASNAAMIAAMLASLPVTVADAGIVGDDRAAITAALTKAAGGADLLVTSGGASVGDHDLVRPSLEAAGATIDFWRVAMRPGKPLIAGRLGETIVLGLPGNPVSAYVTALLFVVPLARMLAGTPREDAFPKTIRLPLAAPLHANDDRTDHLRAMMTADGLMPAGPDDSAAMLGLARADVLIVRAPHAPAVAIGDLVDAIPLA